jgi:hypothetical protein
MHALAIQSPPRWEADKTMLTLEGPVAQEPTETALAERQLC